LPSATTPAGAQELGVAARNAFDISFDGRLSAGRK
jgi:hypothetical protein